MALVRILIDGYNLLHAWQEYRKSKGAQTSSPLHLRPELAPGRPCFSAAARDELIYRLTLYRDVVGTPITIFFDGGRAPSGTPKPISTPDVEVLYSKAGQTADEMIERAACRFAPYGEVLAVTNDNLERDTVQSVGGFTSGCLNFIQTVETALGEMADDIKDFNRRESRDFQRRRL